MASEPSFLKVLIDQQRQHTRRPVRTPRQLEAQLDIINSVQAGLVAQLDMQDIYDLVGEKLRQEFDSQVVMIGTYDVETGIHQPRYLIEMGRRIYLSASSIGPAAKYLIQSQKTLRLNTPGELDAHGMQTIDGTRDVKSAVWVPLIVGNKITGSISLQNIDREYAFSDSDVQLLEMLANSMSLALESARLFDETQQRNAELAIINSVQQGLVQKLDVKAIYELVGDQVRDLTDAQTLVIYSVNHAAQTISFEYIWENGARLDAPPRPLTPLNRYLIEWGKPFMINEGVAEFLQEYDHSLPAGEMPKAFITVPFITNGLYTGAISIQDTQHEHAFTENDLRLLETIASSVSVAIENARLFAETQRLLEETAKRAAELATVNTVGQALVREIDLDTLIQLIGDQLQQIFEADIVYVALHDRNTSLIKFPYNYGEEHSTIEFGEGLTSIILETCQPLLINEDMDTHRKRLGTRLVGRQALSYLGVPIVVGGQAIGAISVQSTQSEGRFSQNDAHLLSTIAANFGAALRNAGLFDEIKRQKTYYETIIANSPAAIILIDNDTQVTGWNPAAERLFGYPEAEALGQYIDDLVARDEDIHDEAVRYSEMGKQEGQIHVITQRSRKDGSRVEVEVMGLPVVIDGERTGFIVIYHDISELQQARMEAVRANEAKSAFLANMSHELRTPLNSIMGFTRIVRRNAEGKLPDKQLANLDKVLASSEHLLGLINSVLDISKIEAGRMDVQLSTFEIRPLIDMVISTIQPLVRQEHVRLVCSVGDDLPGLISDMEKVRQILFNLLSNAAKFTHQGRIELSAFKSENWLVIQVRDTGIGISAEALEHIFEEFKQGDSGTTRQYGGTGLGLSISRSLAHMLDGDLTAESEQGHGSTFTLTLPLERLEPELTAEMSKAQP